MNQVITPAYMRIYTCVYPKSWIWQLNADIRVPPETRANLHKSLNKTIANKLLVLSMQGKREILFIQVLIKPFMCIIYAFPFVWVKECDFTIDKSQ